MVVYGSLLEDTSGNSSALSSRDCIPSGHITTVPVYVHRDGDGSVLDHGGFTITDHFYATDRAFPNDGHPGHEQDVYDVHEGHDADVYWRHCDGTGSGVL